MRRAYPLVLALRGAWHGTIDDEYCADWRKAMVAAGAIERNVDVLVNCVSKRHVSQPAKSTPRSMHGEHFGTLLDVSATEYAATLPTRFPL